MNKTKMPDWLGLCGRSGERNLWAGMNWNGPETVGDGFDPAMVVAAEGPEAVPFPIWFERVPECRDERRGDILWPAGRGPKLVSRRFADRVLELGVTGCRTYEVELLDARRRPIEGYVGFIEDPTGQGEIVMEHGDLPGFYMLCTPRIVEGLKEAGITDFEINRGWPDLYPEIVLPVDP